MGSDSSRRATGRNAQLVRILAILRDLDVGGANLYDLAERNGTTTRTIRRDLEALQAAGVPVERDLDSDDKRGRWKVAHRTHLDKLKTLLDTSHYLALRFAMGQGGVVRKADGFFAKLEDLATRIEDAIGPRGRAEIKGIEKAVHSYEKFLYQNAPADVFWPLVNAILAEHLCKITYRAPRAEARDKTFDVLPLKVFAHDNAPYLLAHVPKHQQVICLNLQRMRALKDTGRKARPPAGFRAEEWENAAFAIYSGTTPVNYKLRFDAVAAPYIRERVWHPTQTLKDVRGGGVEISFTCSESYEVTAWAASWRDKVEVLSPASLRKELARVGEWMAGTYGGSGGVTRAITGDSRVR